MRTAYYLTVFALSSLFIGCNNNDDNGETPPVENQVAAINYTLTQVLPHDTSSFTQGLEFYKGFLFEGTGNYGGSRLKKIDFKTGKVVKEISIDSTQFGEGITIFNDTIYQLTWREKVVNLYSVADLKKIGQRSINTEGWGLTNDGKNLIVTDGSNNLYFYQPGSFRLMTVVQVMENETPTVNLNELEYINGFVYANQWQYNYILKIDPSSGKVVGKMDLSKLAETAHAKNPNEQFLNGIAHNKETDKIYVTGKYWPELYEISFPH
jgi:glutamine cyclotransferase